MGLRAPNPLATEGSVSMDTRKEEMLSKLDRDRENISALLQ